MLVIMHYAGLIYLSPPKLLQGPFKRLHAPPNFADLLLCCLQCGNKVTKHWFFKDYYSLYCIGCAGACLIHVTYELFVLCLHLYVYEIIR